MKTLSFVKIRCKNCKKVTLIPICGEFNVTRPLRCEECGKTILMNVDLGNKNEFLNPQSLQLKMRK